MGDPRKKVWCHFCKRETFTVSNSCPTCSSDFVEVLVKDKKDDLPQNFDRSRRGQKRLSNQGLAILDRNVRSRGGNATTCKKCGKSSDGNDLCSSCTDELHERCQTCTDTHEECAHMVFCEGCAKWLHIVCAGFQSVHPTCFAKST